ncbi:MAG: Crp/Fnr family transcriptional regulator [Muribaculaceae bacterium]|nr:Crp/Fnr family transcriptional regulator [Muribaculaceae bacterium]
MASMYETILELPLFKGIGEEQLSYMLEKTGFDFLKFNDRESIYLAGEKVKGIDFILDGKVINRYAIKNSDINVLEIMGKGSILGANNLYGMITHYLADSLSIGKVSVMRVDKAQYMSILQIHPIFILNFVNYLSAAAQRNAEILIEREVSGISRDLKILGLSLTSRMAERIMIEGSDESFAEYCGVSLPHFREWKKEESANGRIKIEGNIIILK